MPSNWTVFWSYPVIYLSGFLARAWYGQLQTAETECIIFAIVWVLIFLTSIWRDRVFGRVSTDEMDQEKEVIRRLIRGKSADRCEHKSAQS